MNITELTKDAVTKQYTAVGKDILKEIALYLMEEGFPECKRIVLRDNTSTVSKVEKPEFWWETVYDEDGDFEDVKFYSTLVPNKPDNSYVKDLMNPDFIMACKDAAVTAVEAYKKRAEMEAWVRDGKPCVYRYGWGWKGAGARRMTKKEAEQMFPKYHTGKGFWTLSWINFNGEKALEFNELSENDMY